MLYYFVFDDFYFTYFIYFVLCEPKFRILLEFFSPGFNFDFLSTSQEIGWEEHLRYGLFSVESDVKP